MSGYSFDTDGDVLVFEVTEELDAADFEEAFERLRDRVERRDVRAIVAHVPTEDPYGVETFRHWEETANDVADRGVEQWAVVASGTKQLSLRSQVSEADLDTYATEELSDAMSWAR